MPRYKKCPNCNRLMPLEYEQCPGCGASVSSGEVDIVELDPDAIQDRKDSLELDRRLGK